jgi:chaperonin GroES
MTETVRPYGKRVLVKLVDAETVTASGLIIPEMAQERETRGLVLAAGDGGDEPLDVHVGGAHCIANSLGRNSLVDEERDRARLPRELVHVPVAEERRRCRDGLDRTRLQPTEEAPRAVDRIHRITEPDSPDVRGRAE